MQLELNIQKGTSAGCMRSPIEPYIWRACGHEWRFPGAVLVMGVLNVTPDSFFDGGRYQQVDRAVARAWEIAEQGADILDIGGESTRPFAKSVNEEEEWKRIEPVLEELAKNNYPIPISVDTRRPFVAERALRLGASIINDIQASRDDPEMWKVVAHWGAGYICMHMQGDPQTMQLNPHYDDVLAEVDMFFESRLERIISTGVSAQQITLDPGIGFGKTLEHNLLLISHIAAFKRFRRPLLLGVSRKSFLGALLGAPVDQRLAGSLACACWAVWNGVDILRVHDVVETKHAVKTTQTLIYFKDKGCGISS